MTALTRSEGFYGWRVVVAAFVLAVFGWGLGFYGPPVYLHAVREARGWSLALVSTAVTVHFLCGAFVIANLPKLYRRFGVPTVTKAGVISLALGITGWAVALEPWHLFVGTLLSGAGWVTMGAPPSTLSSLHGRANTPGSAGVAYTGRASAACILAALGRDDRSPGLPIGCSGDRPGDDRNHLGTGRRVFCQDT